MAREGLCRRPSRPDKDLEGIEIFFELDRASATRKGIASDARTFATDGGFEAPRNSLDVPFSGSLEARRNSEVRCEEIPIGYELSRSLTAKRRKEDDHRDFKSSFEAHDQGPSKLKGNVRDISLDVDSKSQACAPSVVARLMGLDDLPNQKALQGSLQSSLRKVLHDDTMRSHRMNQSNILSSFADDCSARKVGNEELSFRKHPQEKQLQEFKKEFVARQALQCRSAVGRLKDESCVLHQKRESNSKPGMQIDSEEFLDALNFLNANKDFFVKVLNDPHSSFAKQLQQRENSPVNIEDGIGKHAGTNLSCFLSECYAHPSAAGVLGDWVNKPDMHPLLSMERTRTAGNFRCGHDNEKPGRSRWHTKGGSATRSGGKGGNPPVPTQIVVLKPNLDRQVNEKCFSPTNPLFYPDVMLKLKTDGKENGRHNIRMKTSPSNDCDLARELLGDNLKDVPSDARAIAKQIVKHMRHDLSHRSPKEGPGVSEPSGRRLPFHRGSASSIGGSNTLFREVVHRAGRDNRLSLRSPSAVNAAKCEKETEHRHLSPSVRRESHLGESKKITCKQHMQVTKSFRESGKVDDSITQEIHAFSKKETSVQKPKALKNTGQNSTFKVRDSKCAAPRVLPRSLSAPAAPCVENRALENESKGFYSLERATCSSRAESSENSAFKERLLSLKKSFSMSKKRACRKIMNAQCSMQLDGLESPASRQPDDDELGDQSIDCKLYRHSPLQAAPADVKVGDDNAEKSLNEVLAEDSMTTTEPPQWICSTDLVDTASETSLDKSEQPSPVSVLETPFGEERANSMDSRLKKIKCHGELPHLESSLKEVPRTLHQAILSQPSSCHSSWDSSVVESLDMGNLIEACLEPSGIHGADFPLGREEELAYILHVLRLSGLTVNGCVMAHPISSDHGLNQSIFGRLETQYNDRFAKDTSIAKNCLQSPLKPSDRRLLFDVVDEVVASALKKRLSQPWMMCSNGRVFVCTGKQLLDQIFSQINCCRDGQSGGEEEALEDMASKDLMRKGPWVQSRSDIESVLMELEKLLCGDIIRELVRDLRR